MPTGIVPFKTPQGHDELARRTLRLGQRHRTVLLLVDGRRSVDQVLTLAHAAGVAEPYYRELLEMALLAVPDDASNAPTMPAPLDDLDDDVIGPNSVSHIELPIDAELDTGTAADGLPPVAAERSTGPIDASVPPPDTGADTLPCRIDGPLEAARELLLRAVREEAPVAGQFTLIKLKRAAGRADLEALLDEVEYRISRPRRRLAAARTVRHARHLLGTPTSTSFTML